jgi:hypothetical protein
MIVFVLINAAGFVAGLILAGSILRRLLGWKLPTLWLLAVIVNAPTLIIVFSYTGSHLENPSIWMMASILLVLFWGIGGLGLGFIAGLVLPDPAKLMKAAPDILSADFWKARQPR